MAKEEIKTKSVIDSLDDLMSVVETIDQDTIETQTQTFPIVQWVNGQNGMKKVGGVAYTGGWFISQESAGSNEALPGWVKDTLTIQSGEEIPGFFKRDIQIAYLHKRLRWRVTDKDNKSLFFPWNEYKEAKEACESGKNPSGNIQILCWVKDLDVLNPVVLTAKGLVGAEFTGNRTTQGVLECFATRVIGTINNALRAKGVKKSFPWRAFWMTIGPQRDAEGTPIYAQVGHGKATSPVTLPALIGVPPRPEVNEVKKLFVEAELLGILNTIWEEPRSTQWAEQWDTRQQSTRVEPAEDQKPSIVLETNDVSNIGDEEIPF